MLADTVDPVGARDEHTAADCNPPRRQHVLSGAIRLRLRGPLDTLPLLLRKERAGECATRRPNRGSDQHRFG
jgi:hypothetical protein